MRIKVRHIFIAVVTRFDSSRDRISNCYNATESRQESSRRRVSSGRLWNKARQFRRLADDSRRALTSVNVHEIVLERKKKRRTTKHLTVDARLGPLWRKIRQLSSLKFKPCWRPRVCKVNVNYRSAFRLLNGEWINWTCVIWLSFAARVHIQRRCFFKKHTHRSRNQASANPEFHVGSFRDQMRKSFITFSGLLFTAKMWWWR